MSSNIVVKTEVQKIVVKNADGKDGKSAYQQAVEGGYTGTEEEFNCSLSLLSDVADVKKRISDAINYKGGEANPNEAFTELAEDIKEIPNFNTNGVEYISDKYIPTTLLDAYYNRSYIKSIIDNYVVTISGGYTFSYCRALRSVEMPNLVTISGGYTFSYCSVLRSVEMPNLVTISGGSTFQNCSALQSVDMPNLVTMSGDSTFSYCSALRSVEMPNLVTMSGGYTFSYCRALQSVEMPNLVTISGAYTFEDCRALQSLVFGTLSYCNEPFGKAKSNLRNITIGENTDINLPFQNWTASSVIAEGQSGIDELNENLYNNLLTKLYDHSQDGQTRTLRLGWLAHVKQENIDYANSKGWTLTT